jgi:hypothetical protein
MALMAVLLFDSSLMSAAALNYFAGWSVNSGPQCVPGPPTTAAYVRLFLSHGTRISTTRLFLPWNCLPGSASQFYLELETTQASEIFADLVHNRVVQPQSWLGRRYSVPGSANIRAEGSKAKATHA